MNRSDKTSEEKQNEPLPPNISWPDVLEEKLTPSEDTTGKWVASTTSFERKGLRFGMESSPASAEVKGSTQAERDREKGKKTEQSGEGEVGIRVRQKPEKESMQIWFTRVLKQSCWLKATPLTCPRCSHWKPCGAWLHGGLESRLQVKEVTLHLHRPADGKQKKLGLLFFQTHKAN